MLKLRKILLSNIPFILLLILTLLITIIRLSINKQSILNNPNHLIGQVIEKHKVADKLTIIIKSKEKVLVTYYIKENESISLGDKIKVYGTLETPNKNTTKYLFNYNLYLKRKDIFHTFKANKIIVLKKNKNTFYKFKELILNRLTNPYLKTFILGDKSNIDSLVKYSYQENGISHLFALSGMHITLLVTIIEKILKKIKVFEEKRYKIISLILLMYLSLVGLSPSILRGVLFYIIFKFNNIYYFYIKPINLYIVVISISLLINPNYIFDVGFQYSFLISLSLIQLSSNLKSKNYLISLLKVSITSFIVSIPISLYNFYQINILGIIYNLIFVPLVSIIIFPLSILVFILKPLEPIYNIFIYILENLSLFLSKIHIGKIVFIRLPIIFYFIYFIIVLIYIFRNKKEYIYLLLILLFIHYLIPYFDKSDYIKMIDIGQGDSILIHSNNKNILLDTGEESFFNTIYPLLKSKGIKKLDFLILSHGDKDHLGEAKTIINNYKVNKILINNNKLNHLEKEIYTNKTSISKEGYYIKLGDMKLVQINENLGDENDSSSVYLLFYKDKKILLTGDASIKTEESILSNYDIGHIDILKVGHHGSKTSTSDLLLNETTPNIALISSGRNNKFNHPNKEVIERLKEHNIKSYNTQDSGTITINLNNYKITKDLK